MALDTWADVLADRHVIHVNNNASLAALVTGYSKVTDCIKLAADYWLRAAAYRVYSYMDRVESKATLLTNPQGLSSRIH